LTSIHGTTFRRIGAFVNAAVVLLALVGVLVGANWDEMPGGLGEFLALRITVKNLIVSVICLTGAASVFYVFGMTKPSQHVNFWKELVKVTKACTFASVFTILFPLSSHTSNFTVQIAFYFLPIAIVACLAGRFAARSCADCFARTQRSRRNLIILGSGAHAESLYQQLRESKRYDLQVLGFLDSDDGQAAGDEIGRQIIGGLDDLEQILMKQPIDTVFIALPADSCHAQIQTAITTCERAGVEAKYFISDIFELSLARPFVEKGEIASVISLKVVCDDSRMVVKRVIDIVGSLIAIILFGPLMLFIAAAIKLTNPGPVVFAQERYGLRKRLFRMYKFRSMVADAEQLQDGLESRNEVHGPAFKIRNDPRVTPLGRFLRKTSLDELPQFFNVLRGQMSLVGPRPLPKRDVSRFTNAALMRRFSVRPGLTCLWQVNGRSDADFETWITLDLKYIDEWSLGLDFSILARTVPAVLRGAGAV
jgi:exopolysaccharide biosynthesis polyprenyl glycosylphosphotransferase